MIRIDTAVCGNFYFHQMTFGEVGDLIPTHRHSYDHVLQVQRGKLRVYTEDGGVEEILAPAFKDIPAGIAHDVEALEADSIGCCIHVLRDVDGKEFPFKAKRTRRELNEATGRL